MTHVKVLNGQQDVTHRHHVATFLSVASGLQLKPSDHPLPPLSVLHPHHIYQYHLESSSSSTCCSEPAGLSVRLLSDPSGGGGG